MEKDLFLKTRVSADTKRDFEEICSTYGVPPTTKLREILETFVAQEYGRLHDRVVVHIFRPDGYDFGAWRVTVKLRNPAELEWRGRPIPFEFPQLPQRRIHPDDDYVAVVRNSGSDALELGGQFVKGVFQGHLYSNGIAEKRNPTSIDDVRAALHDRVQGLLDRYRKLD